MSLITIIISFFYSFSIFLYFLLYLFLSFLPLVLFHILLMHLISLCLSVFTHTRTHAHTHMYICVCVWCVCGVCVVCVCNPFSLTLSIKPVLLFYLGLSQSSTFCLSNYALFIYSLKVGYFFIVSFIARAIWHTISIDSFNHVSSILWNMPLT